MLIPFGAAVIFKPSPTKSAPHKPVSTGLVGIVLGYRFAPGGGWNGEYLVRELSYFTDVNLRMDAPGHSKSLSPHVTKQVRLPKEGDITFPVRRHRGSVNFTFEGARGSVPPNGADFDLLEHDGGDPYKSGEDPTDHGGWWQERNTKGGATGVVKGNGKR